MTKGLYKCGFLLPLIAVINISFCEGYSPGEGDRDNLSTFQVNGVRASNGKQKLRWVQAHRGSGPVPECAVVVGWNRINHPIYVGRVNFGGNQLPAKISADNGYVGTQYGGLEHALDSYEALCNGNLAWIPFDGEIPNNALVLGKMVNGENVHIGRGVWQGNLEPGMVLPSQKVLYLPNGGMSHRITNFELLIDLDHVSPGLNGVVDIRLGVS